MVVIAVSSVTITIARNVIFNNVIGIWLAHVGTATVTAIGLASNRFFHVTKPVVTVP